MRAASADRIAPPAVSAEPAKASALARPVKQFAEAPMSAEKIRNALIKNQRLLTGRDKSQEEERLVIYDVGK